MNFFGEVLEVLTEGNRAVKFDKFDKLYLSFKGKKYINFQRETPAKPLEKPSYSEFCNVVSMKNLNKKIAQKEREIYFIHSVAHIEFSAIDIALDECYRFDCMPYDFYSDWLEVAKDEIRHFLMIENLLKEQGGYYGQFEVHDGLFVALKKTENSLLNRMALLPRYMEANGLDANAHIIEKLKKDSADEKLIKALETILNEEISHVYKGDKWFKFACKKEGKKPEIYTEIIRKLYPNSFSNFRNLNEIGRIKAGFTKEELESIKALAKK